MPVDFPGHPRRCTSTSRSSKRQCRNFAVPDTDPPRCRYHGGRPKSIAAVRSGRYSSLLPTNLAEHYQRVSTDPELLNLRDQVALVQARMLEVLGEIRSESAAPDWHHAVQLWKEFVIAYESANAPALEAAFAQLDSLMKRASHISAAWDNVLGMMETVRRLVETETRRQAQASASITVERAMVLVGALAHVVRKYITDPVLLARAQADLAYAVGMTGAELARQLPADVDVDHAAIN